MLDTFIKPTYAYKNVSDESKCVELVIPEYVGKELNSAGICGIQKTYECYGSKSRLLNKVWVDAAALLEANNTIILTNIFIGGVLGGLTLLASATVLAYVLMKKKKNNSES